MLRVVLEHRFLALELLQRRLHPARHVGHARDDGVLARLGVTPNYLTLLSLVTGLAFCPAFLWDWKITAFALLLLHALFDGVDGPLARFTGKASNRGSFTDTAADQVVVTFSTVTLIHAGYVAAWPGALYLFFYTIVVIFAMVRNALAVVLMQPLFGRIDKVESKIVHAALVANFEAVTVVVAILSQSAAAEDLVTRAGFGVGFGAFWRRA